MTTNRSVLAERPNPLTLPSTRVRRALAVVGFALATALAARVALPLPGTPVPFTFGPLLVLLSGALLGGRLGAYSQALYVGMGMIGLPVFAAGGGLAYLLGPTGGYLAAYPLAAFVAGALGGRGALRTLGGLLAGLATIFLGGLAWLAATGAPAVAVLIGLRPFLLADLVKVGMAAVITLRLRGRARQLLGD